MPLVALDKNTQKRIDITRIENPRQELKAEDIVCPLCEAPMVIVAGSIRIHHFRHKANCNSDYKSHPESYEHLRTKALVAQNVGKWFKEFTSAEPRLEVPIPEVKRIADVMFIFPNGWRVACEVQLASITIDELQQRTDDYLRAGVDVFWFLGKNAASESNIRWATAQQGFAIILQYSEQKHTSRITPKAIEL